MSEDRWIVILKRDGNEAPVYVGPWSSLDNASRFAEHNDDCVVAISILDPPEDYAC